MADDERMASPGSAQTKPMGLLIGLGVLLITLGVVFGLVGIGIVAKRKQRYRINEQSATVRDTNGSGAAVPGSGTGK